MRIKKSIEVRAQTFGWLWAAGRNLGSAELALAPTLISRRGDFLSMSSCRASQRQPARECAGRFERPRCERFYSAEEPR
jgi:hypothetical protein